MRTLPAPTLPYLRPRLATLALAVVGILGVFATSGPARAAEGLPELVRDFEARLARRDDAGYAAQREALDRIADLRSREAQKALAGLLAEYGRADRRTASLILGARVRRGAPRDVDEAIAWVEGQRDALLMELLPRVVASAEEPGTWQYVRTVALPRATPPVKAQIARGLGLRKDPDALMPLLGLLREEDLRVRAEAMAALGSLRDPRALPPLQTFLRNEDPRLRVAAAEALGVLGDPLAVAPLLRTVAEDAVTLVVETAAEALAAIDRPEAIPTLIERLEKTAGKDARLEDALARSLARISGKAFGPHAPSWRSWWEAVKSRPFSKVTLEPGGTTVEGPRYYDFPIRSSKLVFVIDVSRSMGWNDRLVLAKEELVKVLEKLPATTRFNVVAFSDTARAWADHLQDAKPSIVARAVQFVERLDPENGTNSWDGLRVALQDPEADTVFFLSDGHPTVGDVVDPDLILAEVANLNRWRRVRIHGIALLRGDPPSAFAGMENSERADVFMRRLTSENRGDVKVIR